MTLFQPSKNYWEKLLSGRIDQQKERKDSLVVTNEAKIKNKDQECSGELRQKKIQRRIASSVLDRNEPTIQ